MYLIFSSPGKLKKIRKTLELKGFEAKETKDDQYLFTEDDLSAQIPFSLKGGTRVMEMSERDGYHKMLKEYGEFAFCSRPSGPSRGRQPGSPGGGSYGSLGLTGIVKEVGKTTCSVVPVVWGRKIKITVGHGDIEKACVACGSRQGRKSRERGVCAGTAEEGA